jgi:hypothetical protein
MKKILIVVAIILISILSFFLISFLIKKSEKTEIAIIGYSLINETRPIKSVKPQKIEVFILWYRNKTLEISKLYFGSKEERDEYEGDLFDILKNLNAFISELKINGFVGKAIMINNETFLFFKKENNLISVRKYTEDFREKEIVKYFLERYA